MTCTIAFSTRKYSFPGPDDLGINVFVLPILRVRVESSMFAEELRPGVETP